MNEFLSMEENIIRMLKTVFDPEIPVNIYDLGLIYKIELDDDNNVIIDMTLTSPTCPMADFIIEDVKQKVQSIDTINEVSLNIIFNPPWDRSMMSEEAQLELGYL